MFSTRIVVKNSIAATPAAVFDCLSNLDTHTVWNAGLVETIPKGRLKLGTEYSSVNQLMGRRIESRNKVADFAENRLIRLVNRTGPLSYDIEYLLGPHVDGETSITCICRISGQVTYFQMAAPLLEYLAEAKLEAALASLKLLVEHGLGR